MFALVLVMRILCGRGEANVPARLYMIEHTRISNIYTINTSTYSYYVHKRAVSFTYSIYNSAI